jgi:hypothetical protein
MPLCLLCVIHPSVDVSTRLDCLVAEPFVIFIQVGIYTCIWNVLSSPLPFSYLESLLSRNGGYKFLSTAAPLAGFNFVVMIFILKETRLTGPKHMPSLKCNAWTRNTTNLYTVMGVTDLLSVEVCGALQMEVFQHCTNSTCINVNKVHICKIRGFHGGYYE